jgi:predicted methyltransferase
MTPSTRRPIRALGGVVCLALLTGACDSARAAEERLALARVLELEPGAVVADVGAGDGTWAIGFAEAVGPHGRVYATEVDEEALEEIRERVADSGLSNVSVVAGSQSSTGLPDRCCDAILLRMVYHHFTDPAAMRRDLLRALRPWALLAVVDIVPQRHWSELDGVPDRGGHGIGRPTLLEEMTAAGFEVVSTHVEWNDDPDRYCIVFRRADRGESRAQEDGAR